MILFLIDKSQNPQCASMTLQQELQAPLALVEVRVHDFTLDKNRSIHEFQGERHRWPLKNTMTSELSLELLGIYSKKKKYFDFRNVSALGHKESNHVSIPKTNKQKIVYISNQSKLYFNYTYNHVWSFSYKLLSFLVDSMLS